MKALKWVFAATVLALCSLTVKADDVAVNTLTASGYAKSEGTNKLGRGNTVTVQMWCDASNAGNTFKVWARPLAYDAAGSQINTPWQLVTRNTVTNPYATTDGNGNLKINDTTQDTIFQSPWPVRALMIEWTRSAGRCWSVVQDWSGTWSGSAQ